MLIPRSACAPQSGKALDSAPVLLSRNAFIGTRYCTDRSIRLLHELDSHARPPRRRSTLAVAIHDKHFLRYDAQRTLGSKSAKELGNVLDLTTILLGRLRPIQGSLCPDSERSFGGVVSSISRTCKRSLANLEHMLECMRHTALEGLIKHSLKRIQGDVAAMYQYWKQRRHSSSTWFAEWPSGRRPLSTTWPWNIKPSLIVLWGVCWMFYANGDSTRDGDQADRFHPILGTRLPPQPTLPPYSRKWRRKPPYIAHIADKTIHRIN